MKKIGLIGILCCCCLWSYAQEQEAQQLLLNWEKLAQLKSILQSMYKGYRVVSAGYDKVRDIAQGNYRLHEAFLDGLLEVSPVVRNYKRITAISRFQQQLLLEQKKALVYFKGSGQFTHKELAYLENVYGNLILQSGKNLEELLLVVTVGTLRMSDDERLQAIDRVFEDTEAQLTFLRSFNNSTKKLALQRQQEAVQIKASKKRNALY